MGKVALSLFFAGLITFVVAVAAFLVLWVYQFAHWLFFVWLMSVSPLNFGLVVGGVVFIPTFVWFFIHNKG